MTDTQHDGRHEVANTITTAEGSTVLVEFETTEGKRFRFALMAQLSHKVSDDLLRASAAAAAGR